MTLLSILRCDHCGRQQEIRPGYPIDDQTTSWGVLHVAGGKRDLCPICSGARTLDAAIERHPASGTLRGSHLRVS